MPATGEAPDQARDLAGTPRELVPGIRWRRVFPGEERQLGVIRRWLKALLPESPSRHDLVTVVTELGTNAIRHTASGRGGWLIVEVTWHGSVVRVAVADGGGPTGPRVIEEPAADHGRGLMLVCGLSARVGVCGDHRGRLVWADVLWVGAASVATVAQDDPYEAAIREGEASLARRFAHVPAWFGRSTMEWWALAGPDDLVTASSARELAGLLYRLSAPSGAWSC
jgi:anti-sigma regulatory factor (Ser/Thr protein kinase)